MGLVKVKVALENVAKPAGRQEVELLVDTRALYSMVPARLLRELSTQPRQRLNFELADGSTIERDVGKIQFFYDGRDAVSPVIFGEDEDAGVLGVVTLEAMGMEVDPLRRQIRPTRLILY